MTKTYGNHHDIKKSQPWKILIPQGPDREQLRDISTLTNRPWARLELAQRYSKLANGPRQHRHPEHDKDRKLDPFRGSYKAESGGNNPYDIGDETEGTTAICSESGIDSGELEQRLATSDTAE